MFDTIANQLIQVASKTPGARYKDYNNNNKNDIDVSSIKSNTWYDNPDHPYLIFRLYSYYENNKRPIIVKRLSDGSYGYCATVLSLSVLLDVTEADTRRLLTGEIESIKGYKAVAYVPGSSFFDPSKYLNLKTPVLYINHDRGTEQLFNSFLNVANIMKYHKSVSLPAFVTGAMVKFNKCRIQILPATLSDIAKRGHFAWKPKSKDDFVLKNNNIENAFNPDMIAFRSSDYKDIEEARRAFYLLLKKPTKTSILNE